MLGRTPHASPAPVSASKPPFLNAVSRPFAMLVLPMVLALFTPLRLAKILGSRLTLAVLGSITAACAVLTVRMVRWHMDTFWSWYQEKKWLPNNANYAQDGAPVMEGVVDIRLEKFGPRPRETCHILTPTKPSGRSLVYVHGGGFVVANSTVLLHSITLFCRQGLTVYSLDYPHAPEHRFPEPLISVLRGLSWLYTTHGVKRVSLFGDSAGAQ
jgi:acetyl esterase/lipase